MPAFNAERHVAKAIESILAQTYRHFELIVVNDHSTDNTVQIVAELAGKDQRIILLDNNRASGPSGARNTGLLRARGDCLAFLDADDAWLPHHLERGVEILQRHGQVDAVFFNFKIVDLVSNQVTAVWFDEKKLLRSLKNEALDANLFLIKENLFHALVEESFIQLQSLLLRKSARDNVYFNELVRRGEDLEFILRVYLATKASFAFCTSVTSSYYRHDESLTTQNLDNVISILTDHRRIFESFLRSSDDSIARSKLNRQLGDIHLNLSYCFRKKKRFRAAMRCLGNCFRYGWHVAVIREFFKIGTYAMLDKIPAARKLIFSSMGK
jgi:glycosyltransferase involved in cell wall biosynthesis